MKTPFRMISGDRKMSHSRTQGRPPANMPEAGPEGALEGLPGPAQAMFNRSASLL